ncbi:MAG: helix-hairpin-helix domain-containing protein [Chitinophagaceae bacterium]|nr:helix-hairpin-helix domain-containing protein [Chitinophagaceae bacterium]
MRYAFILGLLCWLCTVAQAQVEPVNPVVEQQLENQAEADEAETEDDSYLQQLQLYGRRPLNLNTATESDLQPFRFLTDLQIQNFLKYRRLAGNLLSIFELQAVPAWDVETINRLRPYVQVGPAVGAVDDFLSRFRGGDHSLLMRKYVYKNLLQFGVLGEKDPGEQFFKGAQNRGFDFYSLHLFARNLGAVRALALGDFTVNLGQGLLTYQSLAFRKSVDVMNIKRQTETFRPYNSPGEINFMRGAAITIGSQRLQLSVFGSSRRVSANAVVDSLNFEDFVSSLSASGFHRTNSEVDDRYNITQNAVGGRLAYRSKGGLLLAANGIHYQLSKPLQRDDAPYNNFQFRGRQLTGLSGEYAYTYRNLHVFGELAFNPGGGKAFLSGLMASLDPRVDLSLLVRSIDRDYHSINGNAFTESTQPINERGVYMGISVRPVRAIRLDAYADFYRFPWLRFRVDRPSSGKDFVTQLTWKPNKVVEVYTRLRHETKAINYSNTSLPYQQTEDVPRVNWRTQVSYKLSRSVTVRARTEMVWYDRGGAQAEEGFLLYADFFYKPLMKPLALNCRLQYFETDGFNSRLYAYENDVLYSFSIPPFADHGYRTYFNANYDFSKKLTAWFRIARTFLTNQPTVGSGNDEIDGPGRTDYRLQFLLRF